MVTPTRIRVTKIIICIRRMESEKSTSRITCRAVQRQKLIRLASLTTRYPLLKRPLCTRSKYSAYGNGIRPAAINDTSEITGIFIKKSWRRRDSLSIQTAVSKIPQPRYSSAKGFWNERPIEIPKIIAITENRKRKIAITA